MRNPFFYGDSTRNTSVKMVRSPRDTLHDRVHAKSRERDLRPTRISQRRELWLPFRVFFISGNCIFFFLFPRVARPVREARRSFTLGGGNAWQTTLCMWLGLLRRSGCHMPEKRDDGGGILRALSPCDAPQPGVGSIRGKNDFLGSRKRKAPEEGRLVVLY